VIEKNHSNFVEDHPFMCKLGSINFQFLGKDFFFRFSEFMYYRNSNLKFHIDRKKTYCILEDRSRNMSTCPFFSTRAMECAKFTDRHNRRTVMTTDNMALLGQVCVMLALFLCKIHYWEIHNFWAPNAYSHK
jgi:hypothetical protein